MKRQRLHWFKIRVALAAAILCANCAPLTAGEIQSLTSIRLQAEAFLMGYDHKSPYPPRIRLGKLDSRLRLKACSEALSVGFTRPNFDHGNTALTVRCPAKPFWKLHLPVQIDIFDDVAVAAKPLPKGQIIDDSAFRFEKRNIALLNHGYFARQDALFKLQAKRNLRRGDVLTPANLAPKLLVRSGQQVTLVLNFQGLEVKSSGKALHSARLGEVVRVRNSQSQKIVEGVVSGEALVEVSI